MAGFLKNLAMSISGGFPVCYKYPGVPAVILKDKQLQVSTWYSDGLVDFSQPPERKLGGRNEKNSFSWPFVCFMNIPNTKDFKLLSKVISKVWEEWEKPTFISWYELALQNSFHF